MHLPWDRHPDDRRDERFEAQDDYGQADYSGDYAYDADRRIGYRVDRETYGRDDEPEVQSAYRRQARDLDETRTWRGRSPTLDRETRHGRERLAVDRRILAIVSERLERDRRIDSSDVEITVDEGVVYLSGTARTREGKRRIEQLADVDGVTDVVNGLRVREPERRGLFGF